MYLSSGRWRRRWSQQAKIEKRKNLKQTFFDSIEFFVDRRESWSNHYLGTVQRHWANLLGIR